MKVIPMEIIPLSPFIKLVFNPFNFSPQISLFGKICHSVSVVCVTIKMKHVLPLLKIYAAMKCISCHYNTRSLCLPQEVGSSEGSELKISPTKQLVSFNGFDMAAFE
jgi:hypothetical protein